ncbi:S-layer homology domain-containing protein [Paenibacillus sp. PAMC21692]|uniref:S-layer homology domain-containing protein n=1 Tax=Paenibacillus sp. PAMC21692 TaxID=2762320 RepID=UPI00164CED23|nr:S-layer homology domain-containing protein [Paenibacillus sp. PAMC21692]QNK57194.1 S-layer homology domain-containing protein [Paenibacillus sp. PAMC21692]
MKTYVSDFNKYCRTLGILLLALIIACSSLSLIPSRVSADGWIRLYTHTGNENKAHFEFPTNASATKTKGQKFTAEAEFDSLRLSAPSYGNNTGKLTLSLYAWDTDYETTTSQEPIKVDTFVNFIDSDWLEINFATQDEGDYLWELSGHEEWVGVYGFARNGNDKSVSFDNGVELPGYNYMSEIELSEGGAVDPEGSAVAVMGWTKLYSPQGDRPAFDFNATATRGQRFNVLSGFDSFRVVAPSYGNNVGELTLSLYAWDTDYVTTTSKEAIISKTFVNFNDNSWLELEFPEQPQGSYLWELSDPVEWIGVYGYDRQNGDPSISYANGVILQNFNYQAEVGFISGVVPGKPAVPTGSATLKTGETAEFFSGASHGAGSMLAYLFDWGDGSLSMSSPVKPRTTSEAYRNGHSSHAWEAPGTYSVKVRAYDNKGNPSQEWSEPLQVVVTEAAEASGDHAINGVQVSSVSSERDAAYAGIHALDGDPSSYWSSELHADDPSQEEHLAVDLGGVYTVDRIVLSPRAGGYGFPRALTLSYSVDGLIWHDVPIYQNMTVPGPVDSNFVLETGGLAAKYFKITANELGEDDQSELGFQLAELKVIGKEGTRFYTSKGDIYDADWSNMFTVYGLAQNELTPEGNRWLNGPGGNLAIGPTEWQLWTAQKLAWTNDTANKKELYRQMLDVPLDDGFIWAHAYGEKHLDLSRHYSNNPLFIMGVHRLYMWTRDNSLFSNPLPSLSYGAAPAYPQGVNTMLDKVREAMEFMLEDQEGRNGLLIIKDPENDGTADAHASNYWDNYPMGYKSAYENVLFYGSVKAMADLEDAAGNPDRATELRELLSLIQEKFNETFWNDKLGRYIATIDVNDEEHDYGFTFLNAMAVMYGLADEDRADFIYDWLDGNRIIEGDTSTGEDIYHWGWAPRANTVAVESKEPYWWFDYNGAISVDPNNPSSSARWGEHLENGGAIFYTSFDDMMGRLKTSGGADSAFARMEKILEEFHQDELRRDPINPVGGPWVFGIVGEYSESGIVPMVMLEGFLGVEARSDGLHIKPNLPAELDNMGLKEVLYAGQLYQIEGNRNATQPTVKKQSDGSIKIIVPILTEYVIPHDQIPEETTSPIIEYPTLPGVPEVKLVEINGGSAIVQLDEKKSAYSIPVKGLEGLALVLQSKDAKLRIKQGVLEALLSKLEDPNGATLEVSIAAVSEGELQAAVEGNPTGIERAGTATMFDVYLRTADGSKLQLGEVKGAMNLTLDYDDVFDKELLGVYVFDEDAQEWRYVGGIVDKENRQISVNIDRLGKYAVFLYTKLFDDVPADHWAARVLQILSAKHLVNGTDDKNFTPDGDVTRAEFAALLVRVLGIELSEQASPFADVTSDQWYFSEVVTAHLAGLVNGTSASTFSPEDNISREQMSAMLVRAYEFANGSIEVDSAGPDVFTDGANVSDWAIVEVSKAIAAGLMQGKGNGQFDPRSFAIRAEAAQVLYNILTK